MTTDERSIIYNEEIERLVLGTLIGERNAYSEVEDIISEECFFVGFHLECFRAIKAVIAKGRNISLIEVKAQLEAQMGDKFDLMKLMDISGYSTFELRNDVLHLVEINARRNLRKIAFTLLENSDNERNDIVDVIEKGKNDLAGLIRVSQKETSTLYSCMTDLYQTMKDNLVNNGGRITGTPTGFRKFDERSSGLHEGNLIVIAGETSQGKTSLMLSMISNAAKEGSRIAVYSLEMTKSEICARLVAADSGVSSSDILYKPLDDTRFTAAERSISRIMEREIYFDDDSTSSIDSIISSIRYMKMRYDIHGAAIDYLQILSVNTKNGGMSEEQVLGTAARRLKNLAKDLGIWIIALSQLSRDKVNPEPSLNRLRASGQIAEACDIVILVYRPEVYGRQFPKPFDKTQTSGMAMIDVAKGRNIGYLKFIVGFDAQTTYYYDIDETKMIPDTIDKRTEIPF